MTKIKNVNQTALFIISCLLKQGKNIDLTSTLIAIMTVFICCISLFQKIPSLGIVWLLSCSSLFLWLIQKYYAIRVSIDNHLFTYFATHSESINERIEDLDDCLNHLRLKKKINRNWLERQRGALHLLIKQIIFLIGQIILFMMIFLGLFFNL